MVALRVSLPHLGFFREIKSIKDVVNIVFFPPPDKILKHNFCFHQIKLLGFAKSQQIIIAKLAHLV
jgi:hypothetical protein